MTENNSRDGFCKARPVLADVTNRSGKRAFSMVSGDSMIKSGDGFVKNVDDNEGDLIFAKQICLGVENLVKEKCRSECAEGASERVSSSFEGKQSCGLPISCSGTVSHGENIALATSDMPNEVKELSKLLDASLGVARADTAERGAMEICDASRDNCVSTVSVPTCSVPCDGDCDGIGGSIQEDEGKVTSGIAYSNLVHEVSDTTICGNDGKDAANLTSSKCESIECSRMANSSGYKFFELERCTASKGDGSSNSSANFDLIKACSCSFCLKGIS